MSRIAGRTDDMLIIRGVNVFPSQIEEALLRVEATAPHYLIEVDRPGVLDAIAQAGGVGIYAKSNAIYVLRLRPDGSSVQLPFHYKQVLKGSNLSQNVKLQPRDTIVVP